MSKDEWKGFESPHEHKVPAEALAHPTQEPVAYFKKWEDKSGEHKDIKFSNSEGYKPLYTHPKEWQGLSDDEIIPMYNEPSSDAEMIDFARAIEAKLKEKNT